MSRLFRQDQDQDFYFKTKTIFHVLEAPRDQDQGMETTSLTSTHDFYTWCGLSVNLECRYMKCAARGLLEIQDAKLTQKIAIWASSHNFVGLNLRKCKACIDNRKKLV